MILSVNATEPVAVKSHDALEMISLTAIFWITLLYFTFGMIVIYWLSKVLADNNAAAMYLPANSPA